MIGHDGSLYARSFASVYDRWYAGLGDPQAVVAAVGKRAQPPATVVEFGAGTGRLAEPLQIAGFAVIALDISVEMLGQANGTVGRVASDMVSCGLRTACADVVLIAYNTLFNIASRPLQQVCIGEAARLIRPQGYLAIENFIAPRFGGESVVEMTTGEHHSSDTGKLSIVTERRNRADGGNEIVGTHIEILPEGTFTRPWRLAYLNPGEVDSIADNAGLHLVERMADWSGRRFDPEGQGHVSWYRSPQ